MPFAYWSQANIEVVSRLHKGKKTYGLYGWFEYKRFTRLLMLVQWCTLIHWHLKCIFILRKHLKRVLQRYLANRALRVGPIYHKTTGKKIRCHMVFQRHQVLGFALTEAVLMWELFSGLSQFALHRAGLNSTSYITAVYLHRSLAALLFLISSAWLLAAFLYTPLPDSLKLGRQRMLTHKQTINTQRAR